MQQGREMSSSTMATADPRSPASPLQAGAPPGRPGSLDYIAAEHSRAANRRARMGVVRPPGHEDVPWALALSGGGIRSATYCLGVLQGLMRAEAPAQPNFEAGAQAAARRSLLRQFDYLSTVSGGGFIGGFFGSLFIRKRLNPQADLDDKATAEQAYKVLAQDPPGRFQGDVAFDADRPGQSPLAWLRENGRYMAPTGGVELYAAAIAIRNWCAVHYVVGTILVCLYLTLAFAHVSAMYWLDYMGWPNHVRAYEVALLEALDNELTTIWWSPAWWLVIPLLLLWLLPAGVAYWMTHPPPGEDVSCAPQRFSTASGCAMTMGIVLMAFAWVGQRALGSGWQSVAETLATAGFIISVGVVWHMLTYYHPSISAQRVALTRALVKALLCLAAIALFAAVHTAAQTLYAEHGTLFTWIAATVSALTESQVHDASPFGVFAGAVVALLVWLVRRLTAAFDEKEREGWLALIPAQAFVAAGAALLLFLVAVFWAQLVLWIQWHGEPPGRLLLLDLEAHREVMQVLGMVLLLALGMAVVVGRFPGFLNLSTLQGFYSARIARAYLGASNGTRFGWCPGVLPVPSVTEPAPGDLMTLDEYHANPLAPMHLINVCLNQNIDSGEHLVHRERKGKPLVILPAGFALDGAHHDMPETKDDRGLGARLTVGEWIGVSGAAIATGMGRGGDGVRALLNGLANLRLGRWWESGVFAGYQSGVSRYVRQTFKTQMYLLDELLARFYGTQRPLQYLSDGGHYENMGLYELLRPARRIKLIVACDCGCDPQYQFEDLANLIRMARIDFAIEIEVEEKIAASPPLNRVFGAPQDFRTATADDAHKCALLLNVYHNELSRRAQRPDARVVVIKPRLTPGAGADLVQYQAAHSAFPQEPTADQSYDEAQWESYRKLGLETARIVFGVGGGAERDAYSAALWRVLLH